MHGSVRWKPRKPRTGIAVRWREAARLAGLVLIALAMILLPALAGDPPAGDSPTSDPPEQTQPSDDKGEGKDKPKDEKSEEEKLVDDGLEAVTDKKAKKSSRLPKGKPPKVDKKPNCSTAELLERYRRGSRAGRGGAYPFREGGGLGPIVKPRQPTRSTGGSGRN